MNMTVLVIGVRGLGEEWLARPRTIEKMSAPHRLEILKHGHRAVCRCSDQSWF